MSDKSHYQFFKLGAITCVAAVGVLPISWLVMGWVQAEQAIATMRAGQCDPFIKLAAAKNTTCGVLAAKIYQQEETAMSSFFAYSCLAYSALSALLLSLSLLVSCICKARLEQVSCGNVWQRMRIPLLVAYTGIAFGSAIAVANTYLDIDDTADDDMQQTLGCHGSEYVAEDKNPVPLCTNVQQNLAYYVHAMQAFTNSKTVFLTVASFSALVAIASAFIPKLHRQAHSTSAPQEVAKSPGFKVIATGYGTDAPANRIP